MKRALFFSLIILWGGLRAQTYEELVSRLSDLLQPVTAGTKEYEQNLEMSDKGNLRYTLVQTDNKGKTKTVVYEFNFADMDPHTVRAAAQRDVISVSVSADKLQKLILKNYDDDKIAYVTKLNFYATDMENGRRIAETVKQLIPLSRKLIERRLSLSGYDDRMNWLISQTGSAESGDKRIEQSLQKGIYPGSVIYTKNFTGNKSDKSYTYSFNLGMLDPRKLRFEIKDNMFTVAMETTRQKKLIKQVNNATGAVSYVSKINMAAKDIEQGRNLKKVLEDIIPLAKEKFDNKIPRISSAEQGYEILNKSAAEASTDKLQYAQSFEGNCIMRLNQTLTSNNASDENLYIFNLADINSKGTEMSVKNGILTIKLPAKNNNKFIRHEKNGELQSYKSEIHVAVPQAEEGYITRSVLKQMAEKCMAKKPKTLSVSEAVDILKNTAREVSSGNIIYEQEITVDPDEKKLEFKKTVSDGKTVKEYLYEVSLDDLNPKSLEIVVSGKKVAVIAKTKHMEKAVKSYKDGKVLPYQNKIEIMAGDVNEARKIKRALHTLIKP